MYKSEITAVFLAAILFTGALTAAIPSFTGDAEAETSPDQKAIKDKEGKGQSQEKVTSNDQKLKAMKLFFTSQDSYSNSDASSVKDNYGYTAAGSEASSDEKKDSNSDASSVKENYGYTAAGSDTSSDEKKDSDSDSDTSSDEKKDSNSDASSVKDNYGYTAAGSEASSDEKDSDSKETVYYDESSYGQVFTKPSFGTDNGNDYDKKILKKIVVVCPDGSKLSFNENNGIMTGGLNYEENGLIDNVIEKVCPAIDSCEECFDWLLNFADNRNEALAIVNTVIGTLNEQNPVGQPELLPVSFSANGYEGSNIWEIGEFFNGLLEDRTNQGEAISSLRNTIQESVDTKEVTPFVGSMAIDIIECIAELEGIDIPLTPTNGNNNPNEALGIPLTSVSSGTVR